MIMANKINYQERLIKRLEEENAAGRIPRILLHACCAPCASSCLEVTDRYCDTDLFFFNPNITVREEYEYRLKELNKLVGSMKHVHNVRVIEGSYEPKRFFEAARGLENEPERGKRCHACYRLRLSETMKAAVSGGYDFFATTLTLSPLKPSDIINEIGLALQGEISAATGTDIKLCEYLPSDFKKNNGYLRSIELSKEYDLYRQNYCGCGFSRRGEGYGVDQGHAGEAGT